MDPNSKKYIKMERKFSRQKILKIKDRSRDGWYPKDMSRKEEKFYLTLFSTPTKWNSETPENIKSSKLTSGWILPDLPVSANSSTKQQKTEISEVYCPSLLVISKTLTIKLLTTQMGTTCTKLWENSMKELWPAWPSTLNLEKKKPLTQEHQVNNLNWKEGPMKFQPLSLAQQCETSKAQLDSAKLDVNSNLIGDIYICE